MRVREILFALIFSSAFALYTGLNFNCTTSSVEFNEFNQSTLFRNNAAYYDSLLMRRCVQLVKSIFCTGKKFNDSEALLDYLSSDTEQNHSDPYNEAKVVFTTECSFLLNEDHELFINLSKKCNPYILLYSNHSHYPSGCLYAAQTFLCNRRTFFAPAAFMLSFCPVKDREKINFMFDDKRAILKSNYDLFAILIEGINNAKKISKIELEKVIEKLHPKENKTVSNIFDMFVS